MTSYLFRQKDNPRMWGLQWVLVLTLLSFMSWMFHACDTAPTSPAETDLAMTSVQGVADRHTQVLDRFYQSAAVMYSEGLLASSKEAAEFFYAETGYKLPTPKELEAIHRGAQASPEVQTVLRILERTSSLEEFQDALQSPAMLSEREQLVRDVAVSTYRLYQMPGVQALQRLLPEPMPLRDMIEYDTWGAALGGIVGGGGGAVPGAWTSGRVTSGSFSVAAVLPQSCPATCVRTTCPVPCCSAEWGNPGRHDRNPKAQPAKEGRIMKLT